MSRVQRVCIESPFAAPTDAGRTENIAYARRAMEHSLNLGEAPFLGHLLYTQVYEDRVPELRRRGIDGHLAWLAVSDYVVLYIDRGVSSGMHEALDLALGQRPVYVRALDHQLYFRDELQPHQQLLVPPGTRFDPGVITLVRQVRTDPEGL